MIMPLRPPVALEVKDLTSGYGKHIVISGVSLSVVPGRLTAISGVNGAGKSTLLGTISGLVTTRAGTISLGGVDLGAMSVPERLRAGVSHCPQGRRILQSLTVEENLDLGAWTRSRVESVQLRSWLYDVFPVLADKRSARGGALSGGQQQMLAIARSLMSAPAVLVVDEPSMGLAPALVHEVYRLLRKLVDLQVAVLLVEEHVRLLEGVADEVLILSRGQFVAAEAESLDADPALMARRVLVGDDPLRPEREA
jgi:branched-chain amino acid transport system ATP-binding protein